MAAMPRLASSHQRPMVEMPESVAAWASGGLRKAQVVAAHWEGRMRVAPRSTPTPSSCTHSTT